LSGINKHKRLILKNVIKYSLFFISLAGCTSLKNSFSFKKATENEQTAIKETKVLTFLNDISTPGAISSVDNSKVKQEPSKLAEKNTRKENNYLKKSTLEQASPLQIKYSTLLNTSVEEVKNATMFGFIDEWYGTNYKLGGTTKKGIDCSAFTQFLFASVYAISLPRTAKEQYKMTDRISRTELKEGDLIFFNTRGGVSHVGVYLQNNKFVHAAASGGVKISDLFDEYWVRRFIGVGRLKEQPVIASGN